jgi:hypothetical protein
MNKAETESLQRLQAHYQTMVDMCSDALVQLDNYKPHNFTFTFSINDKPIVVLPIPGTDGNFCLSCFISWQQYYKLKLLEVQEDIERVQWDAWSEKADQL